MPVREYTPEHLPGPSGATWSREAVVEALALKFPSLTPRSAARAEHAERDFYEFVKQAWPRLEPGPFQDGEHIRQICIHLQAVTEGKIRRLLINIPPRHTKSRLVNVFWPAWEWIRQPHLRFLCLSYDSKLTTRDSTHCRDLIDSAWYQRRWGRCFTWKKDQNAKTRYENSRGGIRIASSIKGLGLGEGGDRFLFDDPHNTEGVLSQKEREHVLRWYAQTMGLRDNVPHGALATRRVLIMQRLHEEDLTGYILANEPELWVHLRLPMEFEPEHACHTQWGGDWRTEAGELLWPERYGRTPAERKQYVHFVKTKILDTYAFAAQAQQRPVPLGGGMYVKSWFTKRFMCLPNEREAGPKFTFTSWDLATKGEETSSWCVGGLFVHYRKIETYYLCDIVRFRAEYPEQERAVRDFGYKYPEAEAHVIENKSNGPAIKAAMNRVLKGVITWDPGSADKPQRWRSVAPRWQAGDVLLPEQGEWVADFITEMCAAPRGTYNDQLDMQSQGIIWNETRDRLPSERKILIGRPGLDALRLPGFR